MKRSSFFLIFVALLVLPAALPAAPIALTSVAELAPPAGEIAAGFGKALVCNERFIVVGAPGAAMSGGTEQGAVYVYHATSFRLLRRLRAPRPANGEKLGSTLALDGSLLFVGAPGCSRIVANGGAVYAFDLTTGRLRWTHLGSVAGEQTGGHALAAAGEVVAVGLPLSRLAGNPDESGYVRLLDRRNGSEKGAVVAPMAASGDRCGASLSASGHFLAVGVPSSNVNGTDRGMVLMVNVRQPTFPVGTFQSLNASTQFGNQVALSGPVMAVRTVSNVLWFRPKDYNEQQWISLPEGSSQSFGHAVVAHGNGFVVSDPDRQSARKVFGYDFRSGALVWEWTDPNAAQGASKFGRCVAVSSHLVVVGDGQGLEKVSVARLPVLPWHPQRVKQVITAGASAPATDARFASVTAVNAAVNSQGEVMTTARLTGGTAAGPSRFSLWSDLVGFGLVARGGDPMGEQRVTEVSAPILNGTDRALFMARLSGSNARVLMENQGVNSVELVREGAIINGGRQLARIQAVVQPVHVNVPAATARFALMGSYRPGVGHVLRSDDSAVFTSPSIGTLGELVREGKPSPAAGATFGQILPRVARSGNEVVFVSALAGAPVSANQGLFKAQVGTGTTLIARKGDPAPQVPGALFRRFLGETCNLAGRYLFRATLSGVSRSEDEGIWSNFFQPDSPQLIVREGWPAFGLPAGVYFSRFQRCFMGTNELVVWATLRGQNVNASNNQGIWRFTYSGPELVLRTGELAAGCGGARYGRILGVDVSAYSHFTVLATLTQCPASTNLALFDGSFGGVYTQEWQRQPQLVARKGLLIDRPSLPHGRVGSLMLGRQSVDAAGIGTKGLASMVGEFGPIFGVRFADGGAQLLRGRP